MINKTLDSFISSCTENFDSISNERKKELHNLSLFVSERLEKSCNLTFICIHNSRRSHFSQVWAQIAANYYNFKNVTAYSGGTEATELYSAVVKTLETNGLQIEAISAGPNPIYSIKYSTTSHPIIGFSKTFDSSFNVEEGFGAVMVCASADTNCPHISSAAQRISLPFEDPKVYDETDQKTEKYLERSTQIATEMLYVFSVIER